MSNETKVGMNVKCWFFLVVIYDKQVALPFYHLSKGVQAGIAVFLLLTPGTTTEEYIFTFQASLLALHHKGLLQKGVGHQYHTTTACSSVQSGQAAEDTRICHLSLFSPQ